ADPGGRAAFVAFLAGGGSVEQAISLMVASPEFAAAPDAFVRALYLRLLGRAAGDGEVAVRLGNLAASGRAGLARATLAAPEFRVAVVGQLYGAPLAPGGSVAGALPTLLHRQSVPPAPQLGAWVGSALDVFGLEVAFASSPEFFANA